MEQFLHSSLLPSLTMVPLTGQTQLEAGERRSGCVVPRGQPPGTGQGRASGGWLCLGSERSQPCLWLPSSSSSESGGAGDPSQRHWRNCCLDPLFLPFEFASFVSTSSLGTQLAPRSCISDEKLAFPGEQCHKEARRGTRLLRKAMTQAKGLTLSLICKQTHSSPNNIEMNQLSPSGWLAPRAGCGFRKVKTLSTVLAHSRCSANMFLSLFLPSPSPTSPDGHGKEHDIEHPRHRIGVTVLRSVLTQTPTFTGGNPWSFHTEHSQQHMQLGQRERYHEKPG